MDRVAGSAGVALIMTATRPAVEVPAVFDYSRPLEQKNF